MTASGWPGLADAIARAERRGIVAGVSVAGPSGRRFSHHGQRRFVAASTVKIPVAVALFRAIDEGRLSPGTEHALQAANKVGGSGVLSGLHDGLVLTAADLAYLMMSVSDNTATNMLIGAIGLARVREVMRSLGLAGSTLGHTMRGRLVDDPATENWAVPDEYCRLVTALLDNEAASPAACAEVIALMERQQNDRRIARHLPVEDRPRWGSKTGSLPGLASDVGFVVTPGGPLVTAIYLEQLPDAHAGEEVIGELARAARIDTAT